MPSLYPASSPAAQASIIKKESALIIPKPAKLEMILASVKEVLSNYSSLRNPSNYEHIVILYSCKNDQVQNNYMDIISEYINSGLAKNQLCIYTYVEKDAWSTMSELST